MPVENAVAGMEGVATLNSTSSEGRSTVTVPSSAMWTWRMICPAKSIGTSASAATIARSASAWRFSNSASSSSAFIGSPPFLCANFKNSPMERGCSAVSWALPQTLHGIAVDPVKPLLCGDLAAVRHVGVAIEEPGQASARRADAVRAHRPIRLRRDAANQGPCA